ncbi:hypothetical protein AB0C34_21735 [Nocardia sp. NPDC049220]|uniref:hypothetical protein n=1 Tax=Nocardia sp. NPDC049220 TaxID=3155273 RepID=UPI0033E8D335
MGIPRRSIEVPVRAAANTGGVTTARHARGIYGIEAMAAFFLLFIVSADAGSGSVAVSLAIGAILMVVLYIGNEFSGGRDNPMAKWAVLLRRPVRRSGVAGCWIAQFVTGLIAAAMRRTVVHRRQGTTVGLTRMWVGADPPSDDSDRLSRDRNRTNRHCEIGHSAVEHGDLVPAISATSHGTTPDGMPLGRMFAYSAGPRGRMGADQHMHGRELAHLASSYRSPRAGAHPHLALTGCRMLRNVSGSVAVVGANHSQRVATSADSAEPGREPTPLLEPDQLLGAISGNLTCDSQLVGWARELGDLHAALIPVHLDHSRRPADFDGASIHADIARVVAEIDSWALFHVPRTRTARKNIHSLGEVISHVAHTYAVAWWTVLHSDDEDLRHEAWFHLGEVQEGYAELVDEIRTRRVQLPLGWRGIRGIPST